MKPLVLLAVSLAIALPSAGSLMAQPLPPKHEQSPVAQKPNPQKPVPQPHAGKGKPEPHHALAPAKPGAKPGPQAAHKAPPHKAPPAVGARVPHGKPFQQAKGSRFKAPPRGQEYRVVDDHLVRIDSKTLKVVAVVGLLSALVK